MKRYLSLALAAFALVIAAPSALAVRIRVVDAPPKDCTAQTVCGIVDGTNTYDMNFVNALDPNLGCQSAAALPKPGADISGFTYCIVMDNISSSPLNTLSFIFTVPAAGLEDDYNNVECDGFPASVTKSSCPTPSTSNPLQAGQVIHATFSANPGVPNSESFYLFVDFANNPGAVSLTVPGRVSVPEPSELGLFGLGLLVMGVGYGWEKRRRNRRTKQAA